MRNKKKEVYIEIVLSIMLAVFMGFSGHVIEKNIIEKNSLEVQAAEENKTARTKVEKTETKEAHGGAEKKAEAETEEVSASGYYPILGESSVTKEQMVGWFNENGGSYPTKVLAEGGADSIETFCQIYIEEADAEGVRAEVAFAQTMKETGWLQFGGDVSIEQYNFAGLGTTGGGEPGITFPDVRTGVRAQIQHLKAYATEEALLQKCVDERYEYVKKGCAPYVEWLGQQENPQKTGWATAPNYGDSIVEMIENLKNV